MELTQAQKARLGLFVAVMVVVLLGTVLTLAGLKMWEPHMALRARFHESVSGLERNAPVRYQGLRIGRVESLGVAADDPAAIEVVLSVDPRTKLFEGTTAQLDQSGLTGLRSVNLGPGDPRRPVLTANALLPTRGSFFGQLTDGATAIMSDVHHVTDALGRLVTDENRHKLSHLVDTADRFLGHLDGFISAHGEQLGEALAQSGRLARAVREASEEAQATLKEVRLTAKNMGEDTHRTLGAITRPLSELDPHEAQALLHHLRLTTERLGARLSSDEGGRAIVSFGGTMDRMGHLVEDVDLAVRAGREDFSKTLSSLRQAADDLREFSRILAQNPTVLVRGRQEGE